MQDKSRLFLVLPETIIIVGNASLTNLSLDVESEREFECRTSPSNPRGQLKVFRRLQNGEEIGDIQYRTSSSYQNGINSIKFLVRLIDNSKNRKHFYFELFSVANNRFIFTSNSADL